MKKLRIVTVAIWLILTLLSFIGVLAPIIIMILGRADHYAVMCIRICLPVFVLSVMTILALRDDTEQNSKPK